MLKSALETIYVALAFNMVASQCPTPHKITMPVGKTGPRCAEAYHDSSSYRGYSCRGQRLDIFEGSVYALSPPHNDKISSVVVAPGCELEVFEHTWHRGQNKKLQHGVHFTLRGYNRGGGWWVGRSSWNDVISSFRCHCGSTHHHPQPVAIKVK